MFHRFISVSLLAVFCAGASVSASDKSIDGVPYDHSVAVSSSADKAVGEKLYMQNACIECHGPRGYSEDPDMFPKIAGLDRQYIIDQLLAFRSGSRQNVIMSPVASMLSEDDIQALAAFISDAK
jgi:cytochrome c553